MKIAFNPSTVAALTAPPNNKDITFDLRGRNIFARGVKFYGTDTNTWRDIKINNVSIGSHTLDLRNGSNITLSNTNGVVAINSTWRPVVDNLTSDSTTSSLSAKQGKVLKALIDGKSNSDHNHDGRYVRKSGDTMSGVLIIDTTNFGALAIKRSDDVNGASIQFRGKSSVYGYIGLNNSNKNKQFLRWNSDTSKVYTILDTSSTYTSSGKGVINGTTITQVDNATNATNSTNARKLVNWYSARPTSLNAQFGDGSLRIFYATSSTTVGKCPADATVLHLAWDHNGGWDSQLAVGPSSNRIYSRSQNNGTWQSWKTLAFTTDIPNKNSWNYDDRYYTKAESNAKYITDITTSVNKLTFTKNGSSIARTITVNNVQSLGKRSPLTERNAISGIYTYGTYSATDNLAPTNYFETLGFGEGVAGTIEIGGSWISGGKLYWRALRDYQENWFSWKTILDSSNYSSILDSRYYTESEVNSLLSKKLDRINLSVGTWNPRGYSLAADYHYNGGDLSISENGSKMYVSIDGQFYQNEGQYRVLDTSDIGSIRGGLTLYQHLSATDANWYPLVWGGSDHKNTNNSTGSLYKSYDKLSWQTSSQTLYATNIQTENIKHLSIGGGIYWNPYVESATDGSDAASITLVKSGVAGGTTLVLSQMNDANDTIQFKTSTTAKLYHNSYPILTTQNTYVNNHKGYIYGTEITQVNNSNSSDRTRALRYSGTGSSEITAYQTDSSYMGRSGWASYIICNHGDGSKYYSQTIAMPFWGSPIYRRLEDGTDRGWKKFYTEENPPSWDNVINKPSSFTPSSHTHTWASITDKLVAGNEFNIVNAGFKESMWFNYLPINDRSKTATISSYHFGNGAKGYTSIIASGFIKSGGNASQLLRADGGVAAFNWSGQSGQPTWLWGGNSQHSYYVYNPSNFRVAYAASAGNADTLDSYHESSFLRYRGATSTDQETTLWSQIGIKQYNNALPDDLTNVYNYGSVISLPGSSSRFEIYAPHGASAGNGLYYRSGWNNDKKPWLKFIDSSNIGSQTVTNAYHLRINSANSWSTWNWAGQSGQPSWLWGSNDGTNMYVWNPSNFRVAYASSAGNADTVDGYHATDGRTFNGNINWSNNWSDAWSDGTNKHPWYGFDHRYPNTGAYSTTITDYFGMTIKTANTLRLDFGTLLLNGVDIHNINVASASKLQTARNIALGTDLRGSANFDGSSNIIINANINACTIRVSSTNELPFKRIAHFETGNSYNDNALLLYISQGYINGSNGICRVEFRTNNISSSSTSITASAAVRWLVRNGYGLDSLYAGYYVTAGKAYIDIYLKTTGGYQGTVIRVLQDSRGGINSNVQLINSHYYSDTDHKEAYGSIEAASTALYNRAYTRIVQGSDIGTVSYSNSTGSVAWANVTGKPTIPNPTDYYWANIKVSASSNTQTKPSVNTIYANNWFRSQGASGWYSESYGGGIYMSDTTWIKTYGDKPFYCNKQIYSSDSIRMGDIYLQNKNEINNGANGDLHLNYRNTGDIILCNGGGKVGIGKSDPLYKLDVAGNGRFQDFVYCNAVYSNTLNHTSPTGHLIIGNKTKEISIRSSYLPDVPAVYLYQKFSTNVYYTANKGFGIRPYYLSSMDYRPIETISGNTYSVVTVGDSVQAISCIIADKANIIPQIRGTLIRFLPGDDGQIVLLKDLNNYGSINGYFYVQPKGCNIIGANNYTIYIADGNISDAYDDGKSRFFIYAKTHKVWIEFYCG